MISRKALAIDLSRRMFLGRSAGSLGALALAHLAGQAASGAAPAGKAKSVICLFQHGGPSQMDLFDPKPELTKHDGKAYPGGDLEVHFDKQKGNCLGSPYKFQKFGQCGMELCELLPRTLRPRDRFCYSEIFYAGGTITRDISSRDLAGDVPASLCCGYAADHAGVVEWVRSEARPGDTVLLMGARDPELPGLARAVYAALA